MNFTLGDKIAALKRSGHVVKEEIIMVLDRDNEEKAGTVWNVYLDGELMCPWGAAGTYRVDWVFGRELEKRLLNLF